MTKRIVDYELEGWIRSLTAASGGQTGSEPKVTWQQRVQYAVGHAINDYYTLIPAVRLHTPIQVLLNRRWPRNQDDFPDPCVYWQVYNRIVSQLTLITGMMVYDYPVALYEKWGTHAAGLDLHLSVIFQAVWQQRGNPDRVTVQKFLVEDNEELVRAFSHMTNVFWHSAFGRPPGAIEVYALLDDRRHAIAGESLDLQASQDYVQLLAEAWESECRSASEKERESGEAKSPALGEPWRLGFS
ncbi:hypothetical protein [Paenibacillus macerans]|uniref:hypothetical protein n=1 Tax=Paenibacillus macerans TaxID=44252 RepID=UPI003D31E99F